jgi:hypothetical protein
MESSDRLIFDVGFDNGDDTDHYLARGFDVVAIEANPELVEVGRRRFAAAIEAGKLRLLNVGIAELSGHADSTLIGPMMCGRASWPNSASAAENSR